MNSSFLIWWIIDFIRHLSGTVDLQRLTQYGKMTFYKGYHANGDLDKDIKLS